MRVVVDLGCLERNGADSLAVLAEEYHPDRMYGFDPFAMDEETEVAGVPTTLARQTAWTYDGWVGVIDDGTASRVIQGGPRHQCFDFSAWLRRLAGDHRPESIVVKMDIEAAEVPILEKMIADGTDELVDELLVEWHGGGEHLEEQLHCKVRRWWL